MYVWMIWTRLLFLVPAAWYGLTGVGVLVLTIREGGVPGIVVAISRLIVATGFVVILWYEVAGAVLVVVGFAMPWLLLRPWLLGRYLAPEADVH